MWTRLLNEKLLSLPDASEIGCNVQAFDGIGMVVEINTDNAYRTYMYDQPSLLKCNEDKNILAIVDIVFEEFSLRAADASPEEYAVNSAMITGALQCTDTTAPYCCSWKVPNTHNQSFQLQARAVDGAENVGTATIQVTSN